MQIIYSATWLLLSITVTFATQSCRHEASVSSDKNHNVVSKNANDCDNLPASYSSYGEAILTIKNAEFEFSDRLGTGQSSWIQDAFFYSCDGGSGYLIIVTSKKE